MNTFEMFATDAQMERDGIWIDYGTGGKFLIARAGPTNTKFVKSVESKTRPHRRQLDDGSIDPELSNRLGIEAFAEAVLLDWKGVKGRDGKTIKFSVKAAVKLLTDLPDLFADLRDQALRMANFREIEEEEAAGN